MVAFGRGTCLLLTCRPPERTGEAALLELLGLNAAKSPRFGGPIGSVSTMRFIGSVAVRSVRKRYHWEDDNG